MRRGRRRAQAVETWPDEPPLCETDPAGSIACQVVLLRQGPSGQPACRDQLRLIFRVPQPQPLRDLLERTVRWPSGRTVSCRPAPISAPWRITKLLSTNSSTSRATAMRSCANGRGDRTIRHPRAGLPGDVAVVSRDHLTPGLVPRSQSLLTERSPPAIDGFEVVDPGLCSTSTDEVGQTWLRGQGHLDRARRSAGAASRT